MQIILSIFRWYVSIATACCRILPPLISLQPAHYFHIAISHYGWYAAASQLQPGSVTSFFTAIQTATASPASMTIASSGHVSASQPRCRRFLMHCTADRVTSRYQAQNTAVTIRSSLQSLPPASLFSIVIAYCFQAFCRWLLTASI